MTLLVHLTSINYDPPSEGGIAAAVQGIHTGRVGEPLIIRAEHLNTWLRESTQERYHIRTRWEVVGIMTELAFYEVRL